MQQAMRALLILVLARGAFSGDSADGGFGPSNCIFVSRSQAGSCMITTDCKGLDTSDVEFGISCVSGGKTRWHSYGKGGFEDNEEFDTGLQCDDCNGPNIDPINGEVTDDKVHSMDADMIHIEPTTPGPVAWMVAPTFEPAAVQKATGGEHSWAPNLWSPESPADQAPPGGVPTQKITNVDQAPPGGVKTQKKITNVDHAPLAVAKQSSKPKITSADAVDKGPHSLLGASSNQKAEASSQQKVEDGYVVADIAEFADTAESPDPSTDSADPSDLDDEQETPAQIDDEPAEPAQRQQFLRPHHSHIQQNTNVQTFAPEVEKFGPRNCISTWRNAQGHCMLTTHCSDSDLLHVDVGLMCVGADGDETRHLFGKDSFDDEEEFDTQITCSKCSADRQAKDNQALSEKLEVLSEGIKELKTSMTSIGENVKRLNAKVFSNAALTQTRAKSIRHVRHVQKKTKHKPIHRVQNLRAALPQSGKGEGEEDSDAYDSAEGRTTDEEQGTQEDQETKQREQEAHEREVEARRKEEKQRACEQGNEFNFGEDDC